jgi:CheY-like chemotaxis protein
MFEWFGLEHTLAAFRWVDDELSALPPEAPFAKWWSARREEVESRLPADRSHGVIPSSLPDRFKADFSRFVLLEELLYELTNGPADGVEAWTGDTLLGTLPPLDGGWGDHQLWAGDVLRWFRRWRDEMESDVGAMVADVQLLTAAPDVEVAPGVRMRIDPEYLTGLGEGDVEKRPPVTALNVSDDREAHDFRPVRDLGRVLIVEAHPGARKALVRFLQARGFIVVGTASDGAEAIQLVSELRVDAVITEIHLAGVDGLTLNAMMREQFPTVPVVILTVYRDEVFEQEAMSAGAAAYLVKQDIDGDEIPGLLREVIEKARRRSRGEDLQVY